MKGRIVTYLRLSKEDPDSYEESNSIRNQRIFLQDYIRSHDDLRDLEIIEISDDGYSGKNMNRPGMQQLIEMVKKRTVSCIIVKDISRFTRDYLEQGRYLEQIFPFMGIRFIAVNDDYDSSKCEGGIGEIDVAFKGMLYDFYSEDLSCKVKSSLRNNRDRGRHISPFAPYGYVKDPDDKYGLLPDPEAAEVVRRIYREYLKDRSMYAIAKGLNDDEILTPGQYIEERDGTRYYPDKKDRALWQPLAVSRILHNEIYAGTFEYGKSEVRQAGDKKRISHDKTDWCRIEENHEAIVSKGVYRRAQEKIAGTKKIIRKNEQHCLVGKVFCGGCGYAMGHSYKGCPKYECHNGYTGRAGARRDCADSIRDDELEKIILDLLSEKIREEIDEERARDVYIRESRRSKAKYEKELKSLENEIARIERERMKAYEDYKEEKLDRDEYLMKKKSLDDKKVRVQKLADSKRAAMPVAEKKNSIDLPGCEEGIAIKHLDRELVDRCIEKIIVSKNKSVEVVWRFCSEQGKEAR